MSSPIRCRGPWKFHKRTSEPDRWLDEMGFFRKHTARDASCLFRAVAEIVYSTQLYHHRVRMECVHFMADKRHLFEGSLTCPFENYLKEMSNPSESGGLVEISAMSHLYRRDFVIFEANKGPQTMISNGYGNSIYLYYSSDTKHFDVVYNKDFINTSSFCQSLVYEILYDGVYQLKDLSYAVEKMLHEKVPLNHIEYFMTENVERRKKQKEKAKVFIESTDDNKDTNNNAVVLKCKHHTEDMERASLLKESLSIFVFNRSLIQLENVCMNCLNVNSAKDLLDNGITPFPYKVAKALDPDIYRNIEFDVWSEMRRELRYGARYSDGTTLQVGVKCLVKLGEDQSAPYRCHIQEMRPDGGPCLVFIEDLGEKRVVKYEQLEPLPSGEARPWAPPYRYSRAHSQILNLSQMLQQIGGIPRKQGLGKARKPKLEENIAENTSPKLTPNISWNDINDEEESKNTIDLTQYQHLDFTNFEPIPVEVTALPLMVDIRPGAAHELHAPNGAPPAENNHPPPNQVPAGAGTGGGGDMHAHVGSPAARASTPAAPTTPALPVPYGGGVGMGGPPLAVPYAPYYAGKVGSVVWVPPQPTFPPPPQHVNPHVYKSLQPNGADLPMNDIPTLRYYFNLGVDCMWAAYGPPPHHAPPRHYPPRDIAQDMGAMSLNERNSGPDHKNKQYNNDKPIQGKGNGQRTLLGPRFNKHGNNNQNKGQGHNNNNNMANKGPNNRRNSYEVRGGCGAGGGYEGGECPEGGLVPVPYVPYPPPVYPVHYYPIDSNEPAMMGMMGGMGYVNYEEGGEFVQGYYPHPLYPPPPPHLQPAHHALPPPHHNQEHK